jgi:GAF domain-containing protein
MAEKLELNKNLPEEEIYKSLFSQIESLINPEEPLISNLANFTAALKEGFDKISWVGFYLSKDDVLYLGPFQGKVACTSIKFGSGVCGTSAIRQEIVIVEDVHQFPGHIACDAGSNSEIVVPLIKDGKLYGVLDLDSYRFSAFNEVDKFYLTKLCSLLVEKLEFNYQVPIIK